MASMWQKTMFYLGLVDDDQGDAGDAASQNQPPPPTTQVRTVATASGNPTQLPDNRSQSVVAGRRVEPPSRQKRRISSNPQHAEAGVLVTEGSYPGVAAEPVGGTETEIIVARTFSDAQLLADNMRNQQAVVLDLRNAETAMVRRLVDFASGLTYGLDGKMVKIAQGVILVTPVNVSISVEERARLAEQGLYTSTVDG